MLQSSCLRGTAVFRVRAIGTRRVAGENTLRRPPARSPAESAVVSSIVGNGTAFMVEGSGTLDIVDGGVVSRPKAKSVTHGVRYGLSPMSQAAHPYPPPRALGESPVGPSLHRATGISSPFRPPRPSGERKGAGAVLGIGTKASIEHGDSRPAAGEIQSGLQGQLFVRWRDTRHAHAVSAAPALRAETVALPAPRSLVHNLRTGEAAIA